LFTALLAVVLLNVLAMSALAQGRSRRLTATGELIVVHTDDFDKGIGKFLYFLRDKSRGKTFRLQFDGEPPGRLISGDILKVTGNEQAGVLLAAGGEMETVSAAVAAAGGEQRTAVMLLNFRDKNLSCSASFVRDVMFSDPDNVSVDAMYQESSFNQVWFSGDVMGAFTLDYDSSGTCDYWGWASAADAAAQASGVNLSDYNRKVYVMPSNSCGWAGLGTVGGNPSRSWIFRCALDDVYGHEVGHNLGMHHAATASNEYGDVSDIMGYAGRGLRQVNGPHKEQMGWLLSDKIVSADAGVYDIAPLEADTFDATLPQVLKIAKPDSNEYYYFSYRQPIGFDANLSSAYLSGVSVHRYRGSGAVQTVYLTTLSDGESFVDAANGVTVTQLSHTATSVRVEVSADCRTSPPTVNLSPSSQSGTAGSTLSYGVTVTNNDGASCLESTFTLSSDALPAGWFASLSQEVLTLVPGQRASSTLSVTSPVEAVDGNYGIGVQATDISTANHDHADQGTYTIGTTSNKGKKGGGGGKGSGKGGRKK
jgi:hypothetical protein